MVNSKKTNISWKNANIANSSKYLLVYHNKNLTHKHTPTHSTHNNNEKLIKTKNCLSSKMTSYLLWVNSWKISHAFIQLAHSNYFSFFIFKSRSTDLLYVCDIHKGLATPNFFLNKNSKNGINADCF